ADGGMPYSGGLDAVLEAQRQMYAPQSGGYQRNIPSQGTSHQLAVAQGTPAPPPSGASNMQTAIGLGKDAYSAYKWADKKWGSPKPATSGLSPAGVQPSGAVTYPAGDYPVASETPQLGTTTYFGPAQDAGTTTTFDAGLGAADTGAAAGATDTAVAG